MTNKFELRFSSSSIDLISPTFAVRRTVPSVSNDELGFLVAIRRAQVRGLVVNTQTPPVLSDLAAGHRPTHDTLGALGSDRDLRHPPIPDSMRFSSAAGIRGQSFRASVSDAPWPPAQQLVLLSLQSGRNPDLRKLVQNHARHVFLVLCCGQNAVVDRVDRDFPTLAHYPPADNINEER